MKQAQIEVDRALKVNADKIKKWAENAPVGSRLTIQANSPRPTGYGFRKGSMKMETHTGSTTVLGSLGGGRYGIITSYPSPRM
jgi:hypothetical protein